METKGKLIEALRPKLKQASLLYLEGFRDGCCLHRAFIYCLRSRLVAVRTGQCFLLNGFLLLGSIFILKSVLIPTLQWILPDHCPVTISGEPCLVSSVSELYSFLRSGLQLLFYVLWFYPLCMFSFLLSNLWYNDIAKYGFLAIGKPGDTSKAEFQSSKEQSSSPDTAPVDKPTDIGRVMIEIAEQVYAFLLLSVFFLQVSVAGIVPFIGKALNFLLLSWMYAYYCFEYKWNSTGLSLDKRLDFFESNWAFFAGFGSPCVLATFFFSRFVSIGIMGFLFPLCVLAASGSDADRLVTSPRRTWKGAGLARLPVFSFADYLLMKLLSLFPKVLSLFSPETRIQNQDKKGL